MCQFTKFDYRLTGTLIERERERERVREIDRERERGERERELTGPQS